MSGLMVALMAIGVAAIMGCGGPIAPVTPIVSGTYEVCSGYCVAGTSCLTANVTTDGFVGDFCTAICDPANPVCPDDGFGIAACVPDPGGTTGLCYAGCPGGAACPGGETCATSDGVEFCVP